MPNSISIDLGALRPAEDFICISEGGLAGSMSGSVDLAETTARLVDKFGCERRQVLIDEGIPARAFSQLMRTLS